MKDNLPASLMRRRRFLKILATGATLALPAHWAYSATSHLWLRDDLPLTPQQTEGPYYPIPSIEQQMFNDIDLTRKLPDDELARGQLMVIEGTVMNRQGKPLRDAVVEVWQASAAGLYNHPADHAGDPELDQHFQYWGRSITGENGAYRFETIVPGEYPIRPARHIHFRVDVPGYRRLTTQSYFAMYGERNARDGIYRRLSIAERNQVTVEFQASTDRPWHGVFDMVLAEL